jgi:antitoxin (DNA-binding transcriptional repressor) of toxin-antitoxin stability system
MNVTVEEIENNPHEYLHRVLEGETLIIYREEEPVAEIRPLSETQALRPIGLAKGEFIVPEDFDEPLPEDVLEQFEGK